MPRRHDANTRPLRLLHEREGDFGRDHSLRFSQSSDTGQCDIASKGPYNYMGTAHMFPMHLAPRLHAPAPLSLKKLPPQLLGLLALLLESLQAVLGRIRAPHALDHLRPRIFL